MTHKLNLSPDPRILPMLGEINLSQERCLAELVDNCIDAFSVLHENNELTYIPQIIIEIPQARLADNAKIVVRDNGPGMSTDILERAVSAGWTGNDPITRLGLFGMGFNIATARLGGVTHVWTTEKGEDCWRGIEINFQRLIKEKHFETELIYDKKNDPTRSGTRVEISKLKPSQAEWFSKRSNIVKVKKFLGQIYSAALQENAIPFRIELSVSGQTVKAIRHCIWSDCQEGRVSHTSKYGDVGALQRIDTSLPSKKYCSSCWMWLPSELNECPTCENGGHVVTRQRRVRGWLGILRYLSETDYGIDFIRNGRKIELQDRSLFKWNGANGLEDEYPIDDPRRRGRIVGEIHLDHCRVSYTKDRFERDDPAWDEMTQIVKGVGPLRPDKARSLGYEENRTPLFLLFQAFRRSTPQPKIAGAYANLLSVPDNDLAVDYAKRFHDGASEYQTDKKWFALLEEEDRRLLLGSKGSATTPTSSATPPEEDEELDGVLDGTTIPDSPSAGGREEEATPTVAEEAVPSLSQIYVDDVSGQRFDVSAYATNATHPLLSGSTPWHLQMDAARRYKFIFDRQHQVFTNSSFLPLEALLAEMAFNIALFARDQKVPFLFSDVFSALRRKYHITDSIDLPQLVMDARNELKHIAGFMASHCTTVSCENFYDGFDSSIKKMIQNEMAKAGISDAQERITSGEFLLYAPYHALIDFISDHPDLYFDQKLWVGAYSDIKFSDQDAALLARKAILSHYMSLLGDVVWLASKGALDDDPIELTRVTRARLALDIIRSYRDE